MERVKTRAGFWCDGASGHHIVRFAAKRCESTRNLFTGSLWIRIALVDHVGHRLLEKQIHTLDMPYKSWFLIVILFWLPEMH